MTFIYNNNELPLFIIKVIFHAVKVREVEKFAHIVFVYEDEWKRFIKHCFICRINQFDPLSSLLNINAVDQTPKYQPKPFQFHPYDSPEP